MALKRILCAVDFSEMSLEAFRRAAEIEPKSVSMWRDIADAAKSHERLAEGRVLGKIVLTVRNATTLS